MNSIAPSEVMEQGANGYIYVRGVVSPTDSLWAYAVFFYHGPTTTLVGLWAVVVGGWI